MGMKLLKISFYYSFNICGISSDSSSFMSEMINLCFISFFLVSLTRCFDILFSLTFCFWFLFFNFKDFCSYFYIVFCLPYIYPYFSSFPKVKDTLLILDHLFLIYAFNAMNFPLTLGLSHLTNFESLYFHFHLVTIF